MNRIVILAALVVTTIVGGGLYTMAAHAEDAAPMTDEHIARIRANCTDAQAALFQLHASDAGLRVNRGQIYESISTKLMAPFNIRLVLNRIDGASLVTTAAEYERQLQAFRNQYQQYDVAMNELLHMNCAKQPVAFYDGVADTRKKRQLTYETTVELQKIIEKYGQEVDALAKNYQAANP
jgi:hypothetical protein